MKAGAAEQAEQVRDERDAVQPDPGLPRAPAVAPPAAAKIATDKPAPGQPRPSPVPFRFQF